MYAPNFVEVVYNLDPDLLSTLPETLVLLVRDYLRSRTATLTHALSTANIPGMPGLPVLSLVVPAPNLVPTELTLLPNTVAMPALLRNSASATLNLAFLTASCLAGPLGPPVPQHVAQEPKNAPNLFFTLRSMVASHVHLICQSRLAILSLVLLIASFLDGQPFLHAPNLAA